MYQDSDIIVIHMLKIICLFGTLPRFQIILFPEL